MKGRLLKRLADSSYKNIAWGTSFDEIKEMVEKHSEDEVTVNEEETIVYDFTENYQGFEGVNAIVIYKCNYVKELESVCLMLSNKNDSNYTDEMLYEGLTEMFSELYGEYEDKSYEKIWTTKKSTITIVYVMDGMFTVEYEAKRN
ncbi:MAG: hypothetical protein IJP29_05310 [Lachnospiraceae bacterium]|nr:hypothetical protein [Lachnospiraceae bacterium]